MNVKIEIAIYCTATDISTVAKLVDELYRDVHHRYLESDVGKDLMAHEAVTVEMSIS